jgi:hypothetical protein
VHVEQLKEDEGRLRAVIGGEPLGRGADDECAVAAVADRHRIGGLAREEDLACHGGEDAEIEGAVVGIEALAQPHTSFEKDRTDESGGLVAVGFEHAGERDGAGGHGFSILLNAVGERLGGRKHRCVRGQGERRLAIGGREERAVLGEMVEARRLGAAVTVGAEVIRAQSVH